MIKDCPQTPTQLVSQLVSPQQILTTKVSGRKDRKCFYCGKKGHYRRDCWYLPENLSEAQGRTVGKLTQLGKDSTMSSFQAVDSEELIRGKCYSCKRLLRVLYDSNAAHWLCLINMLKFEIICD